MTRKVAIKSKKQTRKRNYKSVFRFPLLVMPINKKIKPTLIISMDGDDVLYVQAKQVVEL